MSDYGANSPPLSGTLSESNPEPLDSIKADISQNINGRLVECQRYQETSLITIDGKRFNGTFTEAMKAAAAMPIRWNGLLD